MNESQESDFGGMAGAFSTPSKQRLRYTDFDVTNTPEGGSYSLAYDSDINMTGYSKSRLFTSESAMSRRSNSIFSPDESLLSAIDRANGVDSDSNDDDDDDAFWVPENKELMYGLALESVEKLRSEIEVLKKDNDFLRNTPRKPNNVTFTNLNEAHTTQAVNKELEKLTADLRISEQSLNLQTTEFKRMEMENNMLVESTNKLKSQLLVQSKTCDSLRDDLEERDRQIMNLENCKAEYDDLIIVLETRDLEKSELLESLEIMNAKYERSQADLKDLEISSQTQSNDASQYDIELDSVRFELVTIREDLARVTEEAKVAQELNGSLESQLEFSSSKYEKLSTDHNSSLGELESQRSIILQNNCKIQEFEHEISDLEFQLEKVKTALDEKNFEMKALDAEIITLKTKLTESESSYRELEIVFSAQCTEISALSGRCEKAEAKFSAKNFEMEALVSHRDILSAKLAASGESTDTLTSTVNQLQSELKEMTQEFITLKKST